MNEKLCSIVIGFVIMSLSGMDAINTIYILSHGGSELNPLLSAFMNDSLSTFLWVKQGVTLLFVSILIYLDKFRILSFIMIVYLILMVYQTILLLVI